ncbi:MAG: hypothetical protein AUG51_16960 [Acidobacteria bacterium 13_1_20CM_3_53_8]|nr:MAG: hypothetical protein AUG51_16960 [Acidobacteria bacterium 13_1_20CM_3_53_8]
MIEPLRDSRARLYKLLEKLDDTTLGGLAPLLNELGFCSLTVCPNCRVDDFVHVEGCEYNFEIRQNELGEFERVEE